jgi:hypothetical protein
VQAHAFATITMYSWWQSSELACRSEIIFFQGGGGVEAGRAHRCIYSIVIVIKYYKVSTYPLPIV